MGVPVVPRGGDDIRCLRRREGTRGVRKRGRMKLIIFDRFPGPAPLRVQLFAQRAGTDDQVCARLCKQRFQAVCGLDRIKVDPHGVAEHRRKHAVIRASPRGRSSAIRSGFSCGKVKICAAKASA